MPCTYEYEAFKPKNLRILRKVGLSGGKVLKELLKSKDLLQIAMGIYNCNS